MQVCLNYDFHTTSLASQSAVINRSHTCLVSSTLSKSWMPMPPRFYEHFLCFISMPNEFVLLFFFFSFKLLPRLEKRSNYR